MLLLSVPVAALCIWFSTTYSSGLVEHEAVLWVQQQNGHVSYDFEAPDSDGSYPTGKKPPANKFLRELLGLEFFSNVRVVILDNKFVSDVSPLTKLRDLKVLAVYIDILPEADLSVIAKFEKLETLALNYTNITERQKQQLDIIRTSLPNCRFEFGTDVTFR